MKALLTRIAKKTLRSGTIAGADVIRLLDYNNKHPMSRATADAQTVAAFDAIMSDVQFSRTEG